MSNNEAIGINEELLNDMIIELGNYEEQISEIFNGMEDSVANALSSYECSSNSIFSQKFSELKNNFPQIKSNLETYQSDLIRAKDSNARINEENCRKFETAISNIGKVAQNNN